MTTCWNQRGIALVAALAIAAVLLPVGAFVVMQCRTDFLIGHHLRAETEAFYVAEAGLAHALSEVKPITAIGPILAGPDHVAHTADDGIFPFSGGPPGPFPYAPFRYDVRVTDSGGGKLRIQSTSSGRQGSTKQVEALVRQAPHVFTPAALHAVSDVSGIDMGQVGFQLSGLDHQASGMLGGPADPLPALTSTDAATVLWLQQHLTALAAQRLDGVGGAPSLGTATEFDLPSFIQSVLARPDGARFSSLVAPPNFVLGTTAAPQITIVAGDLRVPATLTGCGVLVIQGLWQVAGTVEFAGVVIVTGGIIFEPTSTVRLLGAVWRGPTSDPRVQLFGAGMLAYSSAALDLVDAALPGLLPHAVQVVGWREQL